MRPRAIGGIGGIAFGVLTFVAIVISEAPGGGYSTSHIATYLSSGHRAVAIAAMYLGLLGVLGLVCLLVELRDVLGATTAGRVAWGTGIAAAASFAVGWGVLGGQIFAHLEGGRKIVIPPPVTYLLGEVGVIFIFGSAAALLGFALIALVLAAPGALPGWLRWFALAAGVCGIAGPAFFTFFVLLLWMVTMGIWLLRAPSRAPGPTPA